MQIPTVQATPASNASAENITDRNAATDATTTAQQQSTQASEFPLLMNANLPLVKPESDQSVAAQDENKDDAQAALDPIDPMAIGLLLTQIEAQQNNATQQPVATQSTQPPLLQNTNAKPVKVAADGLPDDKSKPLLPQDYNKLLDTSVLTDEVLPVASQIPAKLLKEEPSVTATQNNPVNMQHHDLLAQAAKAELATPPIPLAAPLVPAAPVVQSDKGVDAMLQLGHIINSHTAALATPQAATSEIADGDYAKAAKRVLSAEYETRIELQPAAPDALKNTINANIKIYPPELGHVLASLKIGKDNTELLIMTENNAVKQIVEANLPQLRQSFLDADINLTNIEVQSSTAQEKNPEHPTNQQANQALSTTADGELTAAQDPAKTPASVLNSLVDTYA